jgi:hypothetical protein
MATQLHRLEHDRVGHRSERLWHVEGSRDRSDKLTELLIDCEEDRTLRALLVGMLRGSTAEKPVRPTRSAMQDVSMSFDTLFG